MSYQSDNLDLEILEEGDPADLTTVSDNFDKIDAVVGDVATIETSPTKSSHAAGEFLLYEGRLYKVTADISAGGSLTLGTNVSAAKIGDELKSLKNLVENVWRDSGDITNFNSFNSFGIHSWNPDTYARPNSTYGVAITFTHGAFGGNYSWIFQLAFGTDNKIYLRSSINNGGWTNWITLH